MDKDKQIQELKDAVQELKIRNKILHDLCKDALAPMSRHPSVELVNRWFTKWNSVK